MAELVADCPRCGSKQITFSLTEATLVGYARAEWQKAYETFCVCRHCHRATVFKLYGSQGGLQVFFSDAAALVKFKGSVNGFVTITGFVSTKDVATTKPPEYLPPQIEAVFIEAATSQSVQCFNAAATMFRLCLDLATRSKLPPATDVVPGLNYKTRRDLGLRLPWLFENGLLPEDLRDLSHAVKEDGNDGEHAGTITSAEVEDLLDFTVALLERMFTQPARLQQAQQRREARRSPPQVTE